MKHSFRKILPALLALALALTGCGGAASSSDDAQGPEATAEAFLTHFYTTDDGGRSAAYDGLAEKMAPATGEEGIATPDALIEADEEYYADMSGYLTDDTLDGLISSRLPYTYDELDAENGVTMTVSDVQLEATDTENQYTFTVTRTDGSAEETRTGDIRLTDADGSYLIDYFHERF